MSFSSFNEANRLMTKFRNNELTIKSFPDMKIKKGDNYEDDILRSLGYDTIPRELNNKFKKAVGKIKFGNKNWDNRSADYIIPQVRNAERLVKDTENYLKGLTDNKSWRYDNHVFKELSREEKIELAEYYKDPKNKKILDKQVKEISKFITYKAQFKANLINRASANLGISWTAIKEGFKWIEHYRSGSARRIDKSVFPFLKAVTAGKKTRPKTVYRGYFISGDKVDPKQEYVKGSSIKMKNTKATSWSTSIGLALEFSIAQDMVKDRDNGYQVVVKYDIQSDDDIIADFRALPGMTFYNQQEILLSQKVKVAEIVYIKQGNKYDTSIKQQNAALKKNGDSSYGETLAGYIRNITSLNKSNLDINDKIFMKEIFNMTTAEVLKRFPTLLTGQNINLKEIGKLNAVLGLQFLGAANFITVRNKNVMIFKNANVYVNSSIRDIAKSIGIKAEGWQEPYEIIASVTYKIVASSYNNIEYVVSIDKYEVLPNSSEDQTYSSLYPTLRKTLLSLPDNELKKYLPGVELKGKVTIRRPRN